MKREYVEAEFELMVIRFSEHLLMDDSYPEGSIIRDDPNDPEIQADPFANMP